MTIIILVVVIAVLAFGFVVFWGAPYVPSHRKETEEAFDVLRPFSKRDLLLDLGSGDGMVLRIAARKGARAVGYELNPLLVAFSWLLSRHPKISVRTTNFWNYPFPKDTTIVYAFSVSRDMGKLGEKLQTETNRLGHPLYFMLYAMELPDKKPVAKHRAHTLYLFTPLHSEKP